MIILIRKKIISMHMANKIFTQRQIRNILHKNRSVFISMYQNSEKQFSPNEIFCKKYPFICKRL